MTAARETPERFLSQLDRATNRPVLVVWEITLACDLKCTHCGSRAGATRHDELSTAECLDIVDEIAALGTRHVVLIGGEAYLRKDFTQIIAAITKAGMVCTMQTGGRNLTEARIRAAVDAGLSNCGVSIDGLRDLHDELRGVRGSFDAAVAALHRLREYGITTSVNTQIARAVLDQLDGILDVVVETGATNWQLQLTVPMGRASDHPERLLQPHDLLAVMPQLADLYRRAARRGVLLQIGNNIGYFGPFEGELRGNGLETLHYQGCGAGKDLIGIEADGKVKGCPSLPTRGYTGGNLHDIDLTSIYYDTPELSFAREKRNVPHSFCGSCYYASVCRGGCTWMSHSLFNRPGDNPFCHHRTLELERQGLRESIRQTEAAPGLSFDHGVFEIAVETTDGRATDIGVPADLTPRAPGVSATELIVCYGCFRHVFEGTVTCPFCASDVASARASYQVTVREAREAAAKLASLLTRQSAAPAPGRESTT